MRNVPKSKSGTGNAATMSHEPVLQVAVNAPLSRLFDYLPVTRGGAIPQAGCRVLVPFGRRKVTAMVCRISDRSELPLAKLRRALQVLDDAPLFDDSDLWLIRFASDYYHHPIGEVVAAALPALLRQGKPLHAVVERIAITELGAGIDLDALVRKAPRQAELLALLRQRTFTAPELDATMPAWKRLRKSFEEKSWIEIAETQGDRAPRRVAGNGQRAPTLNADQAAALQAIRGTAGFKVSLLDGVTGSGKTEVYLRLIEEEIGRQRQVLVLVPEIGLTPQFVTRLERRLGIKPVSLHSSLSDAARLEGWREARDGSALLILGTRSAVFAPLKNPGLIVVDEEHDASFKQQDGLRYSARDLAVARGKRLDIPVVLGSATPSLESLQHAERGAYRRLVLPTRAGRASPPHIRIVDLQQHPARDGLSQPALSGIEKNLREGGQTLVFLNRRGFAPTLVCPGCGAIAECRRCDARMTVHRTSERLMCHHCGATRPLDRQCGDCGSSLKPLGQGTQRVETALESRFAGETIARIDSDSTRLKGTMNKALAAATAGDTRILVGTQMLSKGHHFPNLTLVVVIDADQGLFSTDFRGTERLAQSLVQVAGRAGREQRQGEVMIQTSFAAHPFWGELIRGGYERVAMRALEEREMAAWPPFSHLALLRAASPAKNDASRFLDTAKQKALAIRSDDVGILGPVSAPMERKAGRYRAQLLFQSRNRQALHKVLEGLRRALETDASARRARWSIDVDPIELF